MPNMLEADETICSVFHDAWDARTPIKWPNMPTTEPEEGQPWVAVHILHSNSEQHTLAPAGGRTFTRYGQLIIQIFVPVGQRGLAEATALAMAANNAYEGKTVNGVRFYQTGVKTIGAGTPPGPWFQMNMSANFEFDEVK